MSKKKTTNTTKNNTRKNLFKNIQESWRLVVGLVLIIAGASLAYGHLYNRVTTLSTTVDRLNSELASTSVALKERSDLIAVNLAETTARLSDNINAAERNIETTKKDVESRVGGVEQKFDQKVGEISGTVTNLEKLSKTDPELLQKYSKVFFLNEHYMPERVADIPIKYLYVEDNPEVIHEKVWPYLQSMLDQAEADDVAIYVMSAYRSFDEQRHLKSNLSVIYGEGTANQFSADQGYSEHQLGTTVDLITTGLGGQLDGFDKTKAYDWMMANAHKYGFTLSYPKGNTFYTFEPWHWRFVGEKLATQLYTGSNYFYDLEQREIDEYLTEIFE